MVPGLREVHTRPWVDQWRTHTDFHAAYCGGELRYPGEGHETRIANLKSREFLKRQSDARKPTDSHCGVERLHLIRRRLAAIRLRARWDIQEQVPGETDDDSPVMVLGDVNQKVHIVELRIHKLELVAPWSGVNLPEAGYHTLEGGQALAFLRTRKGVGDGSDLSRISSQQVYMAALVRTLQQDGVLNSVERLYGIARVAADTMVLSTSLGSLDVMVAMARALRGIPNQNILFIQYPVLDADTELYPGRVIPNEVLATEVVERLKADEPFTLGEGSLGFGSTDAEISGDEDDLEVHSAEELEGVVGQTADDETCAVAR